MTSENQQNFCQETEKPSSLYIRVLVVVLAFSALMRFRNLDTESFWLDELTTLSAISQGSWRSTMEGWLSMVGMGTWLMYYWKVLVGDSDFALRSLSAICGVLLVLVVSEFTRKIHDEKAAIIASSMISISHLAILYSQEFRPYMFTTLFIWSSFYLIRLDRKLRPFEILFCIILLSFSYLVHYLAGLAIVLGLLTDFTLRVVNHIKNEEKHQNGWKYSVFNFIKSKGGQTLQVSVSIAFLAYFMLDKMIYDSSNTGHSMWINDVPKRPVVSLFDYFFAFDTRGYFTDIAEFMWYFVLATPVILLIHRFMFKKKGVLEEAEWFVWLVGGGTMLIVVIYSLQVRNLWVSRYFVFSMPAWYMLFGLGISRIIDIIQFKDIESNFNPKFDVSKIIAITFSAIFVLYSTTWLVEDFNYYEKNGRSDFKGMSIWLDDNVDGNQDDVFIVSQPYSRYWDLYLDRMGSDVEIDVDSDWGDVTSGQVTSILDDEPTEVIHIRGHRLSMWDYDSLTLVLKSNYELVESVDFIEGQIDVYHRI